MSTFKPQRQFNGTPGQPSEGAGGPDMIERDLDEINVMFNPETTHANGDPGGIGAGNLNESVLLPEPEPGATISERLASKTITGLNEVGTSTPAATVWTQIKSIFTTLLTHVSSVSNPHIVTKSQVGLGNADNTSDADKPLSTAMTAALNLLNSLKVNVADIVNTLTETAAGKVLDARQGAVLDGKITSMTAALNLLNSLKVNVADIVNTLTETAAGKVLDARQGTVLNERLMLHTNNVENPHLVNKSQVGLGAVNNTSDADKPISTAQAAEFAKMVKKDGSVAMDALTVTGNASAGGNMDIGAGKKYKIGGTNLSAADVDAIPKTRKVNDKELSVDISLDGRDITIGAVEIYQEVLTEGSSTTSTFFATQTIRCSSAYDFDRTTGKYSLQAPLATSLDFINDIGKYFVLNSNAENSYSMIYQLVEGSHFVLSGAYGNYRYVTPANRLTATSQPSDITASDPLPVVVRKIRSEKISVLDIANDLGTETVTKVLSAPQGKALFDMLKEIRGSLENIVYNGSFTSTEGWTCFPSADYSHSVENNVLTVTVLTDAGADGAQILYNMFYPTLVPSHQYHLRCAVRFARETKIRCKINSTTGAWQLLAGGVWHNLELTATAGSTSGMVKFEADTRPYEVNETIEFKEVILVDLTNTFSVVDEATIEKFDAFLDIADWWNGEWTLTANDLIDWIGKLSIALGDTNEKAGDLTDLDTTEKGSLVGAINENADLISSNTTQIIEKTSYGVYTGLVVAQQTVADMTVKVSAGTIYMANGDRFTPSAVASLAVTAANTTNPRVDIVYVSSLGAITYLAGTAAATPSAPAVPTGGALLAEINVANGATSVVTANIADRRKFLWTEAWITPTLLNGWTVVSGNTMMYMKDAMGFVHIRGEITGGTLSQPVFTLPVGYRPVARTLFAVPATVSTGTYATIGVNYNGTFTVNYGVSALIGEIIFKAV